MRSEIIILTLQITLNSLSDLDHLTRYVMNKTSGTVMIKHYHSHILSIHSPQRDTTGVQYTHTNNLLATPWQDRSRSFTLNKSFCSVTVSAIAVSSCPAYQTHLSPAANVIQFNDLLWNKVLVATSSCVISARYLALL